jgi:hypothetical protein
VGRVVAIDIGGIHVPDNRTVFLATLAVHIGAGGTAVAAGALAATARKRPGRHPRAGTVYLCALAGVFATAAVLATLRWRHDWHLFVIAVVAFALGSTGWLARRRRWHQWLTWHAIGMAGSYTTLLTGFYVDNGPQLPLWDRLPHLTYWLLPTALGAPLTWRALARNHALPSTRRTAAVRGGPPPRRAAPGGGHPGTPRAGRTVRTQLINESRHGRPGPRPTSSRRRRRGGAVPRVGAQPLADQQIPDRRKRWQPEP